MRNAKRDSTTKAPRRRRDLLRALAETPVLPHRSATSASVPHAARVTLGNVVRRDPAYAPPSSVLARIGAAASGACPPPRRSVLVATKVDHPPHGSIDPILGGRPLRPQRSATNLLHQVLRGLWSIDDVPVAVPEAGPQPWADGESCAPEQRPPHSAAPLFSQVPPPEEVVEIAEPPQAEAQRPQTCGRPCGPVSPGARSLAAKAGRIGEVDPTCLSTHKFEDSYVPFAREGTQNQRGKPSPPLEHESPCPCECVCTPRCRSSFDFFSLLLDWIDPVLSWLDSCVAGPREVFFPDASIGLGMTADPAGVIPIHTSGSSPALDALRGGQSQGLGMFAGTDQDLGVMRPALTLTALATAGIPGPTALAPPELPGAGASFVHTVRPDEPSHPDGQSPQGPS